MRTEKKQSGFTLMEMLIVVAVIAVLAAAAIPVISKNVHKSQEMADVANVRAYFAYLQADYMSTGEYLPGIGDEPDGVGSDEIKYPDGTTVKLKVGRVFVIRPEDAVQETTSGYQVHYMCMTHYDDCSYTFGA